MERKGANAGKGTPKQWILASLAYIFLLVLVFRQAVFYPLTKVLSLFSSDLPRLFYPLRVFALKQLKTGHPLPLWDPHVYGGAPFLGNFESALLYPFNVLFLLLPMPLALNSFFLLHVFLAGFSMYLWANSRKLHPIACWLAGAVYMFGGAFFLHIYAGHMAHLATIAWVPLVFLAVDKVMENHRWGWVLFLTAILTLQILAGYPQYFYIESLLASLYVAFNLWKKLGALGTIGQLALSYAWAFGIAAVQLGAGWAASKECWRGQGLGYAFAGSYSLPPEYLLTTFLPDSFERFQLFRYGRSDVFWDSNMFLGTAVLLLALVAIKGLSGKIRWMPLALIGIALVLAFGAYTPLYHLLYSFLPGISRLRGSSKFKLMVCLFLILLAAQGLDLLLRQKPQERRKNIRWMAVTGLVLCLLALVVFSRTLEKMAGFVGISLQEGTWANAQNYLFLDLLAAAIVCYAVLLLIATLKEPSRLGFGLVLLAMLELFAFTQTHLSYFDWRTLEAQEGAVSSFLKGTPDDYRIMTNMGNRVEAAGGSHIWGCDPFVPARYYRFMAFSQGTDEQSFEDMVGNSHAFPVISNLFHLIRCRYAVMDLKDHLGVTQFAGKDLPRVSLMGQWEKGTDPADILPRLADPKFPYLSKAIVEENPGFPSSLSSHPGTVKVTDLSTDQMEITADLKEPALLVLGENYTENWKARGYSDDGSAAYRVIPADYILRAVPLTAGHHHFLLYYRPTAYVAGLWLSLLSLALYLAALGRWAYQSRHKAWVLR